MSLIGWLQIFVLLALVVLAGMPIGAFIASLIRGERNVLTPMLRPVERRFYQLAGVDAAKEQGALEYAIALLAFNTAGFLLLYGLQRSQQLLPLNPRGFDPVPADLAFNTGISFLTNADWQNYAGETTMSHFTQMAGLTVQNFLSAATGMAMAFAVIRAFASSEISTIGNFWVDVTRTVLYVLLPLAVVVAIVMVALGVPQTLIASVEATTLEGAKQMIAIGPVASQEAIKFLGDNGGGFFNVNSAHPLENPSALSNMLEIWAQLVVPVAVVFAFGATVGERRQGHAILWVMGIVLVIGLFRSISRRRRQPHPDEARCRSVARQSRGQGAQIRPGADGLVHDRDERLGHGLGGCDARFARADRGLGAALQPVARLRHAGRRRARVSTACWWSRFSRSSSPVS